MEFMSRGTVSLPLFLLAVALMVLWAVIGARGGWVRKGILILALPFSTLVVWATLGTYQGWPTDEPLPDRFKLVWADVLEPGTPHSGPYGVIFVWIKDVPQGRRSIDLLGYQSDQDEPRAYRLPYTRGLHEQIAKMLDRLRQGSPVTGMRRGNQDSEDETPQFYEAPPEEFPSKDM